MKAGKRKLKKCYAPRKVELGLWLEETKMKDLGLQFKAFHTIDSVTQLSSLI